MRTIVGRSVRKLEIVRQEKIGQVTVNVHDTLLVLLEIQCH